MAHLIWSHKESYKLVMYKVPFLHFNLISDFFFFYYTATLYWVLQEIIFGDITELSLWSFENFLQN